MIGIIDLGFSNINSITNALKIHGEPRKIKSRNDWSSISSIKKIIFPGVGSFHNAIKVLNETGLGKLIKDYCNNGGHYLGICLGMQILTEIGYEGGESLGLGIIPGSTVKMTPSNCDDKIPHNGWNEVYWTAENPLQLGIENGKDFYFNHSYCVQIQKEFIGASTPFGGAEITSAIQYNNIFGTQFHPEKSQKLGAQVLENFIKIPC